jgi:6-phosphogluconolactonase
MSRGEAATRVYVGNADSQDLTLFDLDDNGGLTARGKLSLQSPAQPGRSVLLATSPDKRFLYAAYLTDTRSTVASYSIDARTGALTQVGARTSLTDVMAYITTDRKGRFLLSASYAGNKVVVNEIRRDGAVSRTVQVVPTEPKAHCILPDPSNRYVLHTSLGGDRVYQQRFSARTGKLTPNSPASVSLPPLSGPRFLRFSADSRFVYVIDELDASVRVLPFDAARGLLHTEVQHVPLLPADFAGEPWGADLHITPDGRFLYASERRSSTLSAFRIDAASGRLTPIEVVTTVSQPRAFDIDPSGQYLICAGQLSNTIRIYAIDPADGHLSALGDQAVGANPTWVEIVASPRD